MSFGANSPQFWALHSLRTCLLYLSQQGAHVVRMAVKEGRAQVETQGPIQTDQPVIESSHGDQVIYKTDYCGCQVIWRTTHAS